MKLSYILLALVLVGAVNALSITSPEDKTYNTSNILLSVAHNETLDSLSYSLGNSTYTLCTNCSTSNTTLNLTEGEYFLTASGIIGNITLNDSVEFEIELPEQNETNNTNETNQTNVTVKDFSMTIDDPEPMVYYYPEIVIDVEANTTLDMLYASLGSKNWTCTNCSRLNDTVNLSVGNYTFYARGTLGNITKNQSVAFMVKEPLNQTNTTNATNVTVKDFSMTIEDPDAKTYYTKLIAIDVRANTTLDMLYASLGSKNWTCTNCSRLNDTVNLSVGNYTFKAQGTLGNITKNQSVAFTIREPMNDTDDEDDDSNETGEPRFTTGFEKLPKMVAAGELTDAELAEIIRSNKLNPGVLNRLIKTGKLGNESLNAILDTQNQPQGIFKKLMGKIGFKNTYAAKIADKYELDDDTKVKLADREDMPEKAKEKIRDELEETGKIPPGQAKKIAGNSDNEVDDKLPPGQAKKLNDSKEKGNNGRGKNK